jgi:hypothetical protein
MKLSAAALAQPRRLASLLAGVGDLMHADEVGGVGSPHN